MRVKIRRGIIRSKNFRFTKQKIYCRHQLTNSGVFLFLLAKLLLQIILPHISTHIFPTKTQRSTPKTGSNRDDSIRKKRASFLNLETIPLLTFPQEAERWALSEHIKRILDCPGQLVFGNRLMKEHIVVTVDALGRYYIGRNNRNLTYGKTNVLTSFCSMVF